MAPSVVDQLSPVPSENRDPNVLSRASFSCTRTAPRASISKHIRFTANTASGVPRLSSDCYPSFASPSSQHHIPPTAVVAVSLQRKRRCRVLSEERHASNVFETRSRRRQESGDSDDKACHKASDMEGKVVFDVDLTGRKKDRTDGCNGGVHCSKTEGPSEGGDDKNISCDKGTGGGGKWRLKAFLEKFGGLTPSTGEEGRVKRLVRAFEKWGKPLQQFTNFQPSASDNRCGFMNCPVTSSNRRKASISHSQSTIIKAGIASTEDNRFKTPGAKPKLNRPFSHSTVQNNLVHHVQFRAPSVAMRRLKPFNRARIAPQPGSNLKQRPQPEIRSDLQKFKTPPSCKPQPFKLLTEERGKLKKEEFDAKLKQIMAEEERHRIPLAQGLPWTTDEPEILRKPQMKENTVPLDIQLNSELRATERAEFDRYVSEKLLRLEQKRLEEELLRKVELEQAIKKMRQEMVPKAQPMPYFDRPFRPKRSSKQLTIPKEPHFHHNSKQSKRQKCSTSSVLLR